MGNCQNVKILRLVCLFAHYKYYHSNEPTYTEHQWLLRVPLSLENKLTGESYWQDKHRNIMNNSFFESLVELLYAILLTY